MNKSVDIRGPNYGDAPNNGGSRMTEAIIVPPTSDPANLNIITITASNVSINGFTVDGNNPLIGADKDALRGVFANADGLTNVVVEKNIVKNLAGRGVRFQQATNYFATSSGATFSYGNLIHDNLVQSISSLGINLRNSMYTEVTDNTIDDARYGIYLYSFRTDDHGLEADRVISGNTVRHQANGDMAESLQCQALPSDQ